MGNSLRCCLACMLPCGALDVVRVVHLSGRVDELGCPLTAADVLAAHPSHALTDAWSAAGASRKVVVLAPDSELKRGRIYFLVPSAACSTPATAAERTKKRRSRASSRKKHGHRKGGGASVAPSLMSAAEQDNYLRELLSEKREASLMSHRRRRSGARPGVWRPRLESIAEEPSETE